MKNGAGLAFVLTSLLLIGAANTNADDTRSEQIIGSVKRAEQTTGIRPSGNFSKTDTRVVAYYRCYYTGTLELPASYDSLKLRQGTKDGCSLNPAKYDVFFYPIEAVASGHVPVTQSLVTAAPERVATVVPHEDFHSQIDGLPDQIAEAAATLVGFIVGAAAVENQDAELFLKKANLINRYYDQLGDLYKSARERKVSKRAALEKKGFLFAALQSECARIPGESRSFGKCVSAPNNAGLAFDYTYTKYYPLLYNVYSACKHDTRCTVQAIVNAPKKQSEPKVVSYFESLFR